MHPLSRPIPIIPSTIIATKEQTKKVITEALTDMLAPDLAAIVTDYFYDDVDVALAVQCLTFDVDGNVRNPDIRANIKSALMSMNCPPAVKAKIFDNFSTAIAQRSGDGPKIYRLELEKISNEILEEGGHIVLRGVVLRGVTVTVNLRNADLTDAHISNAEICSDLSGANLTNARFKSVGFRFANLSYATSTGLKIKYSNFIKTEVTGMTIAAPALLELRSDKVRTRPSGEQETAQFLNGFMPEEPEQAVPQARSRCSIM